MTIPPPIKRFLTAGNGFRLAYVVTVFLLLAIPAIGMKFKRNYRVDNRKAALFPRWSPEHPAEFSAAVEQWISDRFRGRDTYIGCWNRILLHLLRESPHDQVLIGKEGYLFFASHFPGKENRNSLLRQLLVHDEAEIAQRVREMESMKPACFQSRRPLLFVAVPTKHSLYFDKLPDSARKGFLQEQNGTPVFTAQTEALRKKDAAYAEKFFLDLYPEAKKHAGKIPLIPRENFHWFAGPYTHLAAWQIARQMGRCEGDFAGDPSAYEEKSVRSDLRFFLYDDFTTDALLTKKDFLPPQERHFPVPLSRRHPELAVCREFEQLEFYAANSRVPAGKILVFGDSFAPAMALDLSRYFSEAVTMDYSAMLRFSPAMALEHLQKTAGVFQPDMIVTVGHGGYIFIPEACQLGTLK